MCIKHYRLATQYDGEYKAVREMRKHAAWYLKGMKNSTDIKNRINSSESISEVINILEDYKEKL